MAPAHRVAAASMPKHPRMRPMSRGSRRGPLKARINFINASNGPLCVSFRPVEGGEGGSLDRVQYSDTVERAAIWLRRGVESGLPLSHGTSQTRAPRLCRQLRRHNALSLITPTAMSEDGGV